MRFYFCCFLFPLCISLSSGCRETTSGRNDAKVYIQKQEEGYALIRNNRPFHIQGVAGTDSLSLLASIGGNTIRTYDTVQLETTLNRAQQYNLAVIVGLILPKSHEDWFYENDSLIEIYEKNLLRLTEKYRDHPALLMWCLGNEPIFYDFSNFRFSTVYNRFLKTLKTADPDHPVAMAMANFSDRAILNIGFKIRELDVLMINTFGRLPKLEADMNKYRWLWNGPFIIGEYGITGPWETNTTAWQAPLEPTDHQKAARLREMYEMLPHQNPRYLGAIAFYWGQRQEVTHTWFNFFSDQGEANASVYALADLWDKPLPGNRPPQIEKLLIDGSDAYNDFLFKPNEQHFAEAVVQDPDGDSLRMEWSIRVEDWLFQKKSAPEPLKDSIIQTDPISTISFHTPKQPGPFRLFVRVTDRQGNFATTNLPFYVVQE